MGSQSFEGVGSKPYSTLVHNYLLGLNAYKVVWMEINSKTKTPRRTFEYYKQLHNTGETLRHAHDWLEAGRGLGFLPRNGLWVLDADGSDGVERACEALAEARILPPMVRTPGGGQHFYFQFPEGISTKCMPMHKCHPLDPDRVKVPWDFKLHGNTLLVAPGTTRDGKVYEPLNEWRIPPVLDPRQLLPWLQLWRNDPPFLTDQRSLKDRIARACAYLSMAVKQGRVSCSGSGGHKTLAGVAAHLVAYLRLDPPLALNLLNHPGGWNSACQDEHGRPFPWTQAELCQALNDAKDAVPAAGVKAYEKAQLGAQLDTRLPEWVSLLTECMDEDTTTESPAGDVLELFCEWFSVPNSRWTQVRHGQALRCAGFKQRRSGRIKKRLWRQVNLFKLILHLQGLHSLGAIYEVLRMEACPPKHRLNEAGDRSTNSSQMERNVPQSRIRDKPLPRATTENLAFSEITSPACVSPCVDTSPPHLQGTILGPTGGPPVALERLPLAS